MAQVERFFQEGKEGGGIWRFLALGIGAAIVLGIFINSVEIVIPKVKAAA